MAVSALEEKLLVSSLSCQDRLVLYLVHAGKKPAFIHFKKVKAEEKEAYLATFLELIDPLPFSPFVEQVESVVHLRILVGKDQEHLDNLLQAYEVLSAAHKAIGFALGYPPSAVESFAQGFYFSSPSTYPPELLAVTEFLFFNPAKDSWQESIDFVTSIRDFVRETAPALYGNIQGGCHGE